MVTFILVFPRFLKCREFQQTGRVVPYTRYLCSVEALYLGCEAVSNVPSAVAEALATAVQSLLHRQAFHEQ